MKVTRVFNFQYIQNPEQNLEQTAADYFWMTNGKEQPLSRGVARTSPMLGHSMAILRLYEILRKMQKHLGDLGHVLSAYAVRV